MRPLRAPFGKGFDPGMAPIFETEPQENVNNGKKANQSYVGWWLKGSRS